ncbi:hypothetical protein G6F65_019922 [Rhizopus arrhizus]|nr:hypothetical protein G6F65_019922 [Rhizopus arrhizus]
MREPTVVRRRVTPAIHQDRVDAAGHRFQHAVQQSGQGAGDRPVVQGVGARRLTAGDALVMPVEHVHPSAARVFQQMNGRSPEVVHGLGQVVERGIAGAHVGQDFLHAFGLTADAGDLTRHVAHALQHVGAQRRDASDFLAHAVIGGVDLADRLHHLPHLTVHAVEIAHETFEVGARPASLPCAGRYRW